MQLCPCGSGNVYGKCCGRFIENSQHASTPEELMRSRYTAYTLAKIDYIANTMKSPAADDFDAEAARTWATQATWIKLEVLSSSIHDTTGRVEFRAHYSYANKVHIMHEKSDFQLLDGLWYYVDGKTIANPSEQSSKRIGRNDPCICGSGKKYKKCCGLGKTE